MGWPKAGLIRVRWGHDRWGLEMKLNYCDREYKKKMIQHRGVRVGHVNIATYIEKKQILKWWLVGTYECDPVLS